MYPDKPTSLFNLQRLLENETSRKPSPAEVIHVLEEMNGNVQRTADQLQIHRSTVHRHLKAHRAAPVQVLHEGLLVNTGLRIPLSIP